MAMLFKSHGKETFCQVPPLLLRGLGSDGSYSVLREMWDGKYGLRSATPSQEPYPLEQESEVLIHMKEHFAELTVTRYWQHNLLIGILQVLSSCSPHALRDATVGAPSLYPQFSAEWVNAVYQVSAGTIRALLDQAQHGKRGATKKRIQQSLRSFLLSYYSEKTAVYEDAKILSEGDVFQPPLTLPC